MVIFFPSSSGGETGDFHEINSSFSSTSSSPSPFLPPLPSPPPASPLTFIWSIIFDELLDHDRYQETVQNSLDTYHNELFRKRELFDIMLEPITLTSDHPICAKSSSSIIVEEDHRCFICLEDYIPHMQIYTLSCGHHFHRECLQESIQHQHTTCPLCRTSIPIQLRPEENILFKNEDGHRIQFHRSLP